MTTELKTKKPKPEHKDKLGRLIALNDFVAYPDRNTLEFGRVIKLNNIMVKVQRVPATKYSGESNKYPKDMLLVEAKDMTWFLLKNSA
jgi:hypothetical protein